MAPERIAVLISLPPPRVNPTLPVKLVPRRRVQSERVDAKAPVHEIGGRGLPEMRGFRREGVAVQGRADPHVIGGKDADRLARAGIRRPAGRQVVERERGGGNRGDAGIRVVRRRGKAVGRVAGVPDLDELAHGETERGEVERGGAKPRGGRGNVAARALEADHLQLRSARRGGFIREGGRARRHDGRTRAACHLEDAVVRRVRETFGLGEVPGLERRAAAVDRIGVGGIRDGGDFAVRHAVVVFERDALCACPAAPRPAGRRNGCWRTRS